MQGPMLNTNARAAAPPQSVHFQTALEINPPEAGEYCQMQLVATSLSEEETGERCNCCHAALRVCAGKPFKALRKEIRHDALAQTQPGQSDESAACPTQEHIKADWLSYFKWSKF